MFPAVTQQVVWNDFVKDIGLTRIANGDKIVIVDMEHDAGFLYTNVDMADDLHPNGTGYDKMANLWFSSISENYNTYPVITAIPDQTFDEGETSNVLSLDDFIADIEDPDESITWTASQLNSANLNITIDDNRQVTAVAIDSNWNGEQTVVFTATDLGMNGKYIKSVNDTIVFTVSAVNDPPFFTSSPVLSVDKGQQYVYSYSASDIDTADVLAFSVHDSPSWLIIYPSPHMLAGIPTSSGDYPATLTVSDGHVNIDQSFTIQVIGSSDDFSNESNHFVKVYPNPATDRIILSIENRSGEIDFSLFNIAGKAVLSRNICATCEAEIILKHNEILPGFYFYKLFNSGKLFSGKIVIQ